MKCINCGAEIGNSKFCEFCGTQVSYDMLKEQEQVTKQGCPLCKSSNIQFNRENQGEVQNKNSRYIVHRTVGFCKDCGYTWYPNGDDEVPKKNNLLWWILGWLFFFPAPIMVLIWRKKNKWSTKVKLIITAAFWIVFFIIGSLSEDSSSLPSESTNEETTIEKTTIDDNSVNDESIEQNPIEDIINISDHPVYYDNIEKATEIWEDYLDDEVLVSSNKHRTDNTIISINGYNSSSSIINDIELFLNNTGQQIELDESLIITKNYLPIDLMYDYYTFEDSYILTSPTQYNHIICYNITEEGYNKREETRDNSTYTMPYNIYINLHGESSIDMISITNDLDNAYWDSNYKRNNIERIEWHYDFLE